MEFAGNRPELAANETGRIADYARSMRQIQPDVPAQSRRSANMKQAISPRRGASWTSAIDRQQTIRSKICSAGEKNLPAGCNRSVWATAAVGWCLLRYSLQNRSARVGDG